jgi:hypothetical protein
MKNYFFSNENSSKINALSTSFEIKSQLSENIFQYQKQKINEIKEKSKESSKIINPNQLNKIISFDKLNFENFLNWKFSKFETEFKESEEVPKIKNFNWEDININEIKNKNYFDNKIFLSKDNIEYGSINLEVNLICDLSNSSILWIFLRNLEFFDEYSIVIKINKIADSQKIYLNMGTFIKDINNKLFLKIFSKQQLINFSEKNSSFYELNDICRIKLRILDTGEEKILIFAYLNDSNIENKISCNFFLPILQERKISFALQGKTNLKQLLCEFHELSSLDDYENVKNYCKCCIIF